MSIASQPLPGAVAVEEHNDVDHTSVSLAVSTVILALRPKDNETHPTLWLPLVRRLREPYKGQWALPGGPLNPESFPRRGSGFDPEACNQPAARLSGAALRIWRRPAHSRGACRPRCGRARPGTRY